MSGFTVQSSIAQEMAIGYEGMIADSGLVDIVSGVNVATQKDSIAVTAANATTYTVTINGTTFSYLSDADATTAEIVAGLVTAINAGSEPVTASGTDTPLILTADPVVPNPAYTLSVGANLAVTNVVPAGGSLIYFGKYTCIDENSTFDHAARLPTASSDVTLYRAKGITVADNYAKVSHGGAFKAQTMFPCMRKGRILVRVEEAVNKGDQAYVRYAAGGLGLGSFRKSAGSSEAAALASSVYLTTVGIQGLAVLEVNLP